jgi:hypothetical protein
VSGLPDLPEPLTGDQLGAVLGSMADMGHDHGRVWVRLDLIELSQHTGNDLDELVRTAVETFLVLPT